RLNVKQAASVKAAPKPRIGWNFLSGSSATVFAAGDPVTDCQESDGAREQRCLSSVVQTEIFPVAEADWAAAGNPIPAPLATAAVLKPDTLRKSRRVDSLIMILAVAHLSKVRY